MKLLDIVTTSLSYQILCRTPEQRAAILAILISAAWVYESQGSAEDDTFDNYPRIVLYGDNREFMTLSAKPSSEVHIDIDADEFIKANS